MKNYLSNEEKQEFYFNDLAKGYEPPRYYLSELVGIFPEVKELIPAKLKELRQEKREIQQRIGRKIKTINKYAKTAMGKWLASLWVEMDEDIVEDLNHQINHFLMIKALNPGQMKGTFEEQMDMARERDILEVASKYTNLVKSNKEWKGRCPLHEEDTPSFTVNPQKNLWHCFGCQAGGSVIDLVMMKENISFKEAVKTLSS